MPDPVSQTSERQSGIPIGIPLAALIAIAFFLVQPSSILPKRALMWRVRR